MSRSVWSGAAVGAVLVQLAVLYLPRAPQVAAGGLPVDKLVHALVFAVPVIALVRAGLPRGWVVAVMAGHAVLSELVQAALLPDRSGDPGDVVADLVGVAIGAAVLAWPTRDARRSSPG